MQLSDFHKTVWEAGSDIELIYVPDSQVEELEEAHMHRPHYADQLGFDHYMNVRLDNLTLSGIEAIRNEYGLSRSDCVRNLIRLGIESMCGVFVEPMRQLELGGVGGSAPYDSQSKARAGKPSSLRPAKPANETASHPHAKHKKTGGASC